MAKKLQYKDVVASEDFFKPLIDSAKESIAVLKSLEEQFKELLKQSEKNAKANPFKSFDDLKDAEKTINETKEAVDGLNKATSDRIKLEQRLEKLQTEEARNNEIINQQIAEQRKKNKELAQEKLGLLDAYQKESKRLNELRKRYKAMAIEQGEASEEARNLKKEVVELDERLKKLDRSLGQSQRDVGDYKRAVSGLKDVFSSIDNVLKASLIIEFLGQFKTAFQGLDTTSTIAEKALGRVSIAFRTTAQSIISSTKDLGVLDVINSIFNPFADAAKTAKLYSQIGTSFTGFSDKIGEAVAQNDKNIDRTKAFNRELADLEIQLARVSKEQEIYAAKAADSTTSLLDQVAANAKALKLAEQQAAIELKIARERESIARANVEVEKLSGEVSLDAQQQLSQATIAVIEGEKQLQLARQASLQERRQALSDIAELELDALIDGYDNQKSINERIIADETVNLATRRRLQEENVTNLQKSVAKQIEVLNRQLKEINPDAQAIDLTELISIQDPVEFSNRLQQLGLSEILTTRQLEVIRDLRTATQDNAETNRDLTASQQDYNEVLADTVAQQEALRNIEEGADYRKEFERLEKNRIQNEIDFLKARLAVAEEGSNEFANLQQQLNDRILDQTQTQLEEEQALRDQFQEQRFLKYEELLERERQLTEAVSSSIEELVSRSFDKRLEYIDKQIDASQKREETLRELAQSNVEDATENLATEQKRQAELERQREKALKAKARAELAVAVISAYAAKIQAGEDPGRALASTVIDSQILTELISTLPGFYEGAEKIEDKLDPTLKTGKDDYLIRADGEERILTGKHNKLIGDMPNHDLAMLAYNYRTGQLGGSAVVDLSPLQSEMKMVRKAIENQPKYLGREYDQTEKAVIDTYISRQKLVRRHQKTGGIWGR